MTDPRVQKLIEVLDVIAVTWVNAADKIHLLNSLETVKNIARNAVDAFEASEPKKCEHELVQTFDMNPPFSKCLACGAIIGDPVDKPKPEFPEAECRKAFGNSWDAEKEFVSGARWMFDKIYGDGK